MEVHERYKTRSGLAGTVVQIDTKLGGVSYPVTFQLDDGRQLFYTIEGYFKGEGLDDPLDLVEKLENGID